MPRARRCSSPGLRSRRPAIGTSSMCGRRDAACSSRAAAVGAREDEDRHLRHVEQEAAIEIHAPASGDDDLSGMAREPELRPERHQLRMPDGKEDLLALRRLSSRHHGIGRDPRQPLVNQMLIDGSAAELRRIVRARVPVARLHEHERYQRRAGGGGFRVCRDVERTVVEASRPRTADADPSGARSPVVDRLERHQRGAFRFTHLPI